LDEFEDSLIEGIDRLAVDVDNAEVFAFDRQSSMICCVTAPIMSDFPVPAGPYSSIFGGRFP